MRILLPTPLPPIPNRRITTSNETTATTAVNNNYLEDEFFDNFEDKPIEEEVDFVDLINQAPGIANATTTLEDEDDD